MVNKNYRSGRNKEYRIMKKKLAEGFDIVGRTAGSHSKVDVFAIKQNPPIIEFIQSKKGYFSANKKKEMEEKYSWLNNEFICSFKVNAKIKKPKLKRKPKRVARVRKVNNSIVAKA